MPGQQVLLVTKAVRLAKPQGAVRKLLPLYIGPFTVLHQIADRPAY